jgi:hypothetical protein
MNSYKISKIDEFFTCLDFERNIHLDFENYRTFSDKIQFTFHDYDFTISVTPYVYHLYITDGEYYYETKCKTFLRFKQRLLSKLKFVEVQG